MSTKPNRRRSTQGSPSQTGQANSAHRAARLEGLFQLLTDARSLIVRARERKELMQSFCSLLVRSQRYAFAWIGEVLPEELRVEGIAQAGGTNSWPDCAKPENFGVLSTAAALTAVVREDRPAVVRDIEAQTPREPWHEVALHCGFQSTACIPMTLDGNTHAVLSVYSAEPGAFDFNEVRALQALADDLAVGLSKLELERQRGQRMRELEALQEASLSLTSSLDLRAVLETILSHTLRLSDASDAHIFLYDGEHLTFGAALWAGDRQSDPYSEPRPDGLTYTVARSGRRIVIPNVDRHELFRDWQWGGSIVGLPLRVGPQVVGVMNVAMKTSHDFDEGELRVLGLLADQAAIAIANARLFERIDNERRRVQLLFDVTSALADTLDSKEILERAITLATKSLRAEAGGAYLLEPGTDRLRYVAQFRIDDVSVEQIESSLQLRLGKGLGGWVAEHRQAVLIPDVDQDERFIRFPGISDSTRSVIAAPILAGERLLGVLSISDRSAFQPEQLESLVAISRYAGLALSNAERYQQTVRRLSELTLLQQVARVINQRLEMQPLIEEVVYQVGELLGYPVVEVYLVEDADLVLCAAWGEMRGDREPLPLHKGIVGKVARSNQSHFAADVDLDEDYLVGAPGMRSEIAVPLRAGNLVVGVLNVESPDIHHLSVDDVRLLELLADQVSVAIENAALYERQRKEAEKLERIVSERTAELADALKQAQEASELKTQFVSDVSHELRTPLSNIRLYVELLAGGRRERFESYLETLQRETDRLIGLIEDLLALSRLDAGTADIQPTTMDLNALAHGLVEDRRRLFGEQKLSLRFLPDEQLPPVRADSRMLSQVLANLMTNALQYTPPGGWVEIETREKLNRGKRWATLSVSDTGLGIRAEEQERIFDRFFRGSAGREGQVPGTGLGLAICKEILDRHNGRITVESIPSSGSKFTIWLPLEAVGQKASETNPLFTSQE